MRFEMYPESDGMGTRSASGFARLDARIDMIERLVLEMTKHIPAPTEHDPSLALIMADLRERHPDV